MTIQIGVVGDSEATAGTESTAQMVGAALASAGAIVVCGGLGGVMAAVCRGARSVGGLTVGFLPGRDPAAANPLVEVVIPTGLGEAPQRLGRQLLIRVIAVGGAYGTLSEIALALRLDIPVIGVATWALIRPDGARDRGLWP